MLCDQARHSLLWICCTMMKLTSRQRLLKNGKQSTLQYANSKCAVALVFSGHCAVHAQHQHAPLILTALWACIS